MQLLREESKVSESQKRLAVLAGLPDLMMLMDESHR